MKSILSITVEIAAGSEVGDAARDLSALARVVNCPVTAQFNGTLMDADKDTEPGIVLDRWCARRRKLDKPS